MNSITHNLTGIPSEENPWTHICVISNVEWESPPKKHILYKLQRNMPDITVCDTTADLGTHTMSVPEVGPTVIILWTHRYAGYPRTDIDTKEERTELLRDALYSLRGKLPEDAIVAFHMPASYERRVIEEWVEHRQAVLVRNPGRRGGKASPAQSPTQW